MRSRSVLLLACIAFGAQTAAADAASIVFRDSTGNISLATPDGSRIVQVTKDATADHKYSYPSRADNGRIFAIGVPNLQTTQVLNADGSTATGPWLFDKSTCSNGPFTSVVDRSGALLAQFYFNNGIGPTSCLQAGTPTTAIIGATSPTVRGAMPSYSYLQMARWMYSGTSSQLVGISDGKVQVQNLSSGNMEDWIGSSDPNQKIASVDVQRDKARFVAEFVPATGTGAVQHSILVGDYTGTPPVTPFTAVCALDAWASSETMLMPRWSPDGSLLSWTTPAGIVVSPAPTKASNGDCVLSPKLVAPGGTQPDWSTADLPAVTPPPSGGNTPTPPANPGGGTTTTAPAAAAKISTLAAKGTRLTVTLSGAATVKLTVRRGKKTVGSLSRQLRPGKTTISLTKLKGKRLKKGVYTVSVTIAGSKAKAKTIRLRVR